MAMNNCTNTNIPGDAFNMKDFDALPREVRQALANSNHNWNCTQTRKAMTGRLKGTKRRKWSAAEIVAKVQDSDAKLLADWYVKLSIGHRF